MCVSQLKLDEHIGQQSHNHDEVKCWNDSEDVEGCRDGHDPNTDDASGHVENCSSSSGRAIRGGVVLRSSGAPMPASFSDIMSRQADPGTR